MLEVFWIEKYRFCTFLGPIDWGWIEPIQLVGNWLNWLPFTSWSLVKGCKEFSNFSKGLCSQLRKTSSQLRVSLSWLRFNRILKKTNDYLLSINCPTITQSIKPELDRERFVWTRIFHVRPHSIGETHFLFVKNWFLKKSWSRHLFYFYFWRENKTRNKTLKKWLHNFWKSVSLKNPSLSPGIRYLWKVAPL